MNQTTKIPEGLGIQTETARGMASYPPEAWSPLPPRKSKTQAALLALFLGGLGIHRFYVGKVGSGVAMLVLSLTFIGIVVTWPWAIIDFIVILCGGFRDVHGRKLR